ncbi:MAG TPA: hypothetical protein VNU45_18010 [Rummeliibacillus sp.]|nr:hypothetical protein [Rummeliibacillus sp.]
MAIKKVTSNFLKHSAFPHPFTLVLNETIDAIPDDAALGIYLYLARKPSDWDIWEQDIMKRFKRGRDHVRKALKILQKLGLLKKTSIKDASGKITSWETTLYYQVTEKPSCGENQVTENTYTGDIPQTEDTCGSSPDYWKTHLLDNPTHTKERINTKERKRKKKDMVIGISEFDKFWEVYPKKVGKEAAHKWFKKNNPSEQFVSMLISDLQTRIKSEWNGKDKQFIPHPASYLNGKRWEDEIISPLNTNQEKEVKMPTERSPLSVFSEFINDLKYMLKHGVIDNSLYIPSFEVWQSQGITSDAKQYVRELKENDATEVSKKP